DVDLRVAFDIAHEPNATRAQNAALPVQQQRRTEVDVTLHALAVEHSPRKLHSALIGAERVRKILQWAFAAHIADGAVTRVIVHQELERPCARRFDLRVARRDDHPLGAYRRTRGLQLRHFLDLDDADPTGTVDADAGVIAVVRHRDAILNRGLEDGLAF